MKKKFPDSPILMVDDEKNFLNSVDFELNSNGITRVECCRESQDVLPRLKKKKYSLILLDLLMPGINGKELLPKIVDHYPEIPVIIITAAFPEKPEIPENEMAKECLQKGAFDYLEKPVEIKELVKTIHDALNLKKFHREIVKLKKELFLKTGGENRLGNFTDITTQSEKMRSILQNIALIVFTSKPVLITGEEGVGKEFIAREIHKQSRRKGEFITFDTSDMDDSSFSEKLFGLKRNNLPLTAENSRSFLEGAQNGTLFINEIANLSIQSQSKLLRLIQDIEYDPAGTNNPVPANARIIAATQSNLLALIETGAFRKDLHALLKRFEINIPPLRERKEDIPILLDKFVKESSKSIGIKPPIISENIIKTIEKYDFPRNISELKQVVYNEVKMQKKEYLSLKLIIDRVKDRTIVTPYDIEIPANKTVVFGDDLPTFFEMEAIYINEIMKRAKEDITTAAKMANLNIKTFVNRLKRVQKTVKKKR